MELLDILLIIFSIGGMCSVMIILFKNTRESIKKRGRKENIISKIDASTDNRLAILEETYNSEIQMLQTDKKRLRTKVTKLTEKCNKLMDEQDKAEENEEIENINEDSFLTDYEIIPEKAMKYAKDLGLNPNALNNPALQPIIMEKLKDNKEVALALGIIQPRTSGQTITSNTESKTREQIIINSLSSQSNMA